MSKQQVILLIEDTPTLSLLYATYLKREEAKVLVAENGAAGLAMMAEHHPDLVLLDLQLPDMDGLDILRHVERQGLPCAVVVVTGTGSVGTAVEAMRAGAYDFLVKPIISDRLLITVRNALERQRLRQIASSLSDEYAAGRFCGFIGASEPMLDVYRVIESAAKSKATVFVTGESGTGKELCADAIHQLSRRRDGPFIALNCGAIPRDLMESEIFGHVKGAFTGAIGDRSGAASLADGGTLFLDEICEMDLALQTKLLRFLQTGTFQRVGGTRTETVDVRYICATNRDPWAEVQAGRFREDLFYRLHVIPCTLPPLREREGDVVVLARHFLALYAAEEGKAFSALHPAVEQVFLEYEWPGNVRQLQNIIRNIVVLHDGDTVLPHMLPASLGPRLRAVVLPPDPDAVSSTPVPSAPPVKTGGEDGAAGSTSIKPLWMVEREAIEHAIELCDGNVPKAAAMLDISASTIYRKRLTWDEATDETAAE